MQINWLTFGAQIVNFLLLTWLLGRFLYRPIVNAMQEREKKIAERMDQAEAARAEAEQEAQVFSRRTAELDHAREELLAKAGREIDQWKQEHQQLAREEIEESRREWFRGIQREREAFLRDLRRRAGEYVYQTARQVLEQLSVPELEQQIVESFLRQLAETPEGQSNVLAQAGDGRPEEDRPVTIRSAFELSAAQRQQVEAAVHDWLGDGAAPVFEVDAAVICGIELRAGGYKLGWSVAATLDSLEEDFGRALDEAAAR